MPQCVAFGCNNRSEKNGEKSDISFHRFPKESTLREKWVLAIKREKWKPSASSIICSIHFKEEDFDRSSPFRTYLKKNVVPSIFPAFPKHLQTVVKERRPLKRKVSFNEPPTQEKVSKKVEETSYELQDAQKCLNRTKLLLRNSKKKLKNVRRKNQRLRKKVAILKNIMKELQEKNLVNAEYCEVLKNISKTSFCLIKRESQKACNPKLRKIYDARLRDFAITLHFLSPKAYSYVRETFQTNLPHPRTISRWYATVNAQPGFSTEVFEVLKQKSSIQKGLVCALIFDSMAIRKRIDVAGNNLYGYVDIGIGTQDDSTPPATEVLVFHVVFINSLWKIPVGYFFVNGCSGEQLSSLIQQCLCLLSEANVTVASVTCDGAASNIAAASKLGCNFKDFKNMKTCFKNGNQEVAFILDPVHMLKLVRNTFHSRKELVDGENNVIKWEYIVKLVELQEKETLKLGNKLTRYHINFSNQKMKAKLAIQLLSASVADALEYCLKNNIQGFEGCEATIKFIKIFNDLFDIMNSRSIRAKYFKQPMNVKNIDIILSFLQKAEEYITTLKQADGQLLCNSGRKTGFLGFLICIQSSKALYKRLVESQKLLNYLPMYKTCQDHIERLFGYVRSRGGHNNNPSALEFMYTFRKILVHKQLHEGSANSGNTIPLDKINILGVSQWTRGHPEENIKATTSKIRMLETDSTVIVESSDEEFTDHCYADVPSFLSFSTVTYDIVEYVAGFVARQLKEKLSCEECVAEISRDRSSDFSLINVKNRGGLVIPSFEVLKICRICETILRQSFHAGNKDFSNLNLLMGKLLSNCVQNNFFANSAHLNEIGSDSHLIWLIEAIGQRYFIIRVKAHLKSLNIKLHTKNIRQQFHKLVLFKGQ